MLKALFAALGMGLVLIAPACSSSDAPKDAATDALDEGGQSSGGDGGMDARTDAPVEAGPDGMTDAMPDGTTDAMADGTTDAMPDAAPCNGACVKDLCVMGVCAECTATVSCSNAAEVCDLDTYTCVECLPSDDQCPMGGYCNADHTCVTGCKLDTAGECVDGVCNDAHACVDCTADVSCVDTALVCRVETETCVECLPGDGDCPAGEYCTDAFTCTTGCKDDTDCASGVCNAQNECDNCLYDVECGEGRVCGTFECGPTCDNGGDPACSLGTDCCDGQCVDTQRDIENCGSCGSACTATQFCGSDTGAAICTDVALGNFCKNLSGAVIKKGDNLPVDNAQADILKTDIENTCSPAPTLRVVNQSDTDVLNQTTGQPVAGGNDLLVVLGGNFDNLLLQYLEREDIAPVYLPAFAGDVWEVRRTNDEGLVYTGSVSGETSSDGHFVLQVVRDPISGTLVLNAWGITADSTVAARVFIADDVLTDLSSFTDSWYVYEWSLSTGGTPTYTFTQLSSG